MFVGSDECQTLLAERKKNGQLKLSILFTVICKSTEHKKEGNLCLAKKCICCKDTCWQ